MPLTSGTRLGPYEILATLGAGGMGEVYRARDARLGRDVAIKVLPESLAADTERLARFEREARALAALNHPHIAQIFGVEEQAGRRAIVMELVEGEDLAARLGHGPVGAAEAIALARQVADALEAAHEAGIVHRDLKPANIRQRPDGTLKVLDFGLAKAGDPAGGTASSQVSNSPTMTAGATGMGVLLGTAAYMAPEQARGRAVDKRADIWAFGVILFELLSGRRLFEGETVSDTLAAVLRQDIEWSRLPAATPPSLVTLLRRCLERDPKKRLRDIGDARFALDEAERPAAAPVIANARPDARLAWIVAAVATLALVVVMATRGREPSAPVHASMDHGANRKLTDYPSAAVISPDGRSVAFVASDSSAAYGLWVRRLDSPTATLLLPLNAWGGLAATLFWSPDSRNVGISGNLRRLTTVPAAGGSPTDVCEMVAGRGASWSRRGVILFAPSTQSALFRVPASGGQPVPVTTLDTARHETSHRFPCFLPDGEHFLYTVLPGGPEGFDIYAGSLGSRKVRKVLTAQSSATYAAPGYLLFRRGSALVAQRFDARSLELKGDPLPLVSSPSLSDLDAEPIATASDDGRLSVLENPPPDAQFAWLERGGAVSGSLALPPGPWGRPVLSPDDRYAVVPNGDDLWRVELARSLPLRLTSGGGQNAVPIWSPDGREIAYTNSGRGREEILIRNSDGSGDPRTLPTTDDQFKAATDWTAKGVVLAIIRSRTGNDLMIAPYPDGGARTLVASEYGEGAGRVSPDGRWLAYISSEAGSRDAYVQSFPEPGHKLRVTSGGADRAWWMPQSNELCYLLLNRTRIMSVKLTRRGEDFEVGAPRILFELPPDVVSVDLTHDGQRLLVTRAPDAAANRRLRLVLDWAGMLKR